MRWIGTFASFMLAGVLLSVLVAWSCSLMAGREERTAVSAPEIRRIMSSQGLIDWSRHSAITGERKSRCGRERIALWSIRVPGIPPATDEQEAARIWLSYLMAIDDGAGPFLIRDEVGWPLPALCGWQYDAIDTYRVAPAYRHVGTIDFRSTHLPARPLWLGLVADSLV